MRFRRLTRPAGALVRVITLTALAAASGLVLSPGVAQAADEQATIDKVTKLNKKAVDEYQNLNFEEARKLLKDALEVCASGGLESHPVAARTHVHLGVVLLAGFKQKDAALKEFDKALEIQGDIKLNKSLATPEIQEVYDEAVAARSTPPKPPLAPGEGVGHEPVTQSPQNKAILIKTTIEPAVGAKKVVLSFSADGADDFGEKQMKEDPEGSGTWVAEIPASATQGAVVDYYIDVMGAEDKTLANKGSAKKPFHIAMVGPNGQILGRKPKKPAAPEKPIDEAPSFFIGLGLGTGFGYASGTGEVNPMDRVSPTGITLAQLGQIVPEFGYFVSSELLLSVQLRYQHITGTTPFYSGNGCGSDNICSPASYAIAGFARATYFLSDGDLRPYVAGTLGFGRIREVAKFESVPFCGMSGDQTCVDTIPTGPVFVGGGGGLIYGLTPSFGLTLGANVLAAFTRFTVHVDVNVGVAYQF